MTQLVILDLNGLICRKVKHNDDIMLDDEDFLDLNCYKVLKRPGIEKFLITLFSKYKVGIWSSTTKFNADKILKWLFPVDTLKDIQFIWYRDRTRLDPDYQVLLDIKFYDTVKILSDIWENPVINEKRMYNKLNTLLIDDSPHKVRFNNDNNVLIVKSFDINEVGTEWVDDIILNIKTKFDLMAITNFVTDMDI